MLRCYTTIFLKCNNRSLHSPLGEPFFYPAILGMSYANLLGGPDKSRFAQGTNQDYFTTILNVGTIQQGTIAPIELNSDIVAQTNGAVGIGGMGRLGTAELADAQDNLVAELSGGDITFVGGVNISGADIVINAGSIQVGSSTARVVDEFSADGNAIQAYVEDATGSTSARAGRFDLLQSAGDGGTPISPQSLRAQLTISNGTLSVAEGYGTFSVATQQDGGAQVVSNLIGSLGFARCLQTTTALAPGQWIAGTQSIVGGASAGSGDLSGSAIVAGSLSHILYDPPLDGVAHGYVASRNGSGAGGTAGSAYKVVIGGGIDDWQYGVDLDTGSATNNYSVADIRLSQKNHIHTGAGAPAFDTASGSLYIRTDGANAGEVLYVNHSGALADWSALS